MIAVQHRSSPPHELADWRALRPPAGPSAAGRQFAWRNQSDLSLINPSDYDADTQMRMQGGTNNLMSEADHSGKRHHLDLEVLYLDIAFLCRSFCDNFLFYLSLNAFLPFAMSCSPLDFKTPVFLGCLL